jgi:hypothetical protein
MQNSPRRCRRVCIIVCQIIETIKSHGWLDGKQSVAAKLLRRWNAFNFRHQGSVLKARSKASFRRDPQPQAKSHDRHGADATEPEGDEPQQALCQRWRIWFRRHQ